ncbi:MAG TPA: class I SAM-dependent methyltransferase [Solirubrobacteraceae bacterium]|nr:class I SAM-dependent methyltransferase [Solirubrobacteraceae bacterium]
MVLSTGHEGRAPGEADADAAPTHSGRAVVWHDLECGSYTVDLPLWRELARSPSGDDAAGSKAGSPAAVLEIGAGTGRVALELARHGHRVTALDLDAELLAALRERAADIPGAILETVRADARTFTLARSDFPVCLAPMQTIQLLGGSAGRLAFLRRARAHLAPGGVLACAITVELEPFDCAAGDAGPSPEIARVAGATWVSRTTRVHVNRHTVRIERVRSVVPGTHSEAPSGERPARPAREHDIVELDRVSVAQLQREGREAGLKSAGTRAIAPTDEHVGSVAVMFSV